MTIRYLADLHFDDEDIIGYDNRPFGSPREMNEAMIDRWNQVCREDDLTYILGDFCAGGADRWRELLRELNGNKILLTGNHDNVEAAEQMCREGLLAAAVPYLEMEDRGRHAVLCHYPIVPFHNHYFGWFHLYGHVHAGYEWNLTEHEKRQLRRLYVRDDICRLANAGAMMPYMMYTPRTLDELMKEL